MIVALTGGSDSAAHAHLANSLAALRARAGRNVLFAYHRSHTPAAGENREWEVVDVKISAVSYGIAETRFQSELEDFVVRYDDVVVDLTDDDSAGSQSVLEKAQVVIIFIPFVASDMKVQMKVRNRLCAAASAGPRRRVLLVASNLQIGFFIHELGSTLDFPANIPHVKFSDMLSAGLIDEQREAIRGQQTGKFGIEQDCGSAEIRNLYRTVFQKDERIPADVWP